MGSNAPSGRREGSHCRRFSETLRMQTTANTSTPALHPSSLFTLAPASGPGGTLPTDSLDVLDLNLVLRQRSQDANFLPGKCLGFALIVEAISRLLVRVEQHILSPELRALDGASVLVASHTFHFVHHFFVAAVFGTE